MKPRNATLTEWCGSAAVLTACFVFTGDSEPAEETKPQPPVAAAESPAAPEAKRLDFNSDTPGVMTLAEFQKKYPDAKKPKPLMPPNPLDKVEGCENFEVRGEPYGMKLGTLPVYSAHYQFLDGVLLSVRLSVHEKNPKGLIGAALTKKYGKPKVEDIDFVGKVLTWDNGTSQVQLMEKVRNATLTDNALQKIHDKRFTEVMEAEIAAQKKAAESEKD